MSEDMPERAAEDTPDRMPERISNRMSLWGSLGAKSAYKYLHIYIYNLHNIEVLKLGQFSNLKFKKNIQKTSENKGTILWGDEDILKAYSTFLGGRGPS